MAARQEQQQAGKRQGRGSTHGAKGRGVVTQKTTKTADHGAEGLGGAGRSGRNAPVCGACDGGYCAGLGCRRAEGAVRTLDEGGARRTGLEGHGGAGWGQIAGKREGAVVPAC